MARRVRLRFKQAPKNKNNDVTPKRTGKKRLRAASAVKTAKEAMKTMETMTTKANNEANNKADDKEPMQSTDEVKLPISIVKRKGTPKRRAS